MEGEGLKGDEAREKEVILFILFLFSFPSVFFFPVFLSCPRNLSYLVSFLVSVVPFCPFPFQYSVHFPSPNIFVFPLFYSVHSSRLSPPFFPLSFHLSFPPFSSIFSLLSFYFCAVFQYLFLFLISFLPFLPFFIPSLFLTFFSLSLFPFFFHSCTPSSFSSTVFFILSSHDICWSSPLFFLHLIMSVFIPVSLSRHFYIHFIFLFSRRLFFLSSTTTSVRAFH